MSKRKAQPTHQVTTHPGFDGDLARIARYIAVEQERPWDAEKFSAALRRHIAELAGVPAGYTKASEGPPRPAYKRVFKKTYLVYHEVFEAERVVRVLYVWHGRRRDRPDLGRQDDPLSP